MLHRVILRSIPLRSVGSALLLGSLLCQGPLAMLPVFAESNSISGQLHFAEGSYRINVGDTLSLNIYNQPDLSGGSILVRADGNASFHGIGEIQVAGKTIREASLLIERELSDLLRNPHVSLTVTDSKPPSIYLAGAILHPGMLQAGGNTNNNNTPSSDGDSGKSSASGLKAMDFRLSSILAASGGVTMDADLANVMISREGQPYRTVNLWNMLKRGDTDSDLMLQNGDSVYIPKLPEQALDDETYQLLLSSTIGPRTFPVRIIGDVKQPGVYELNSTSPLLNSAIAKGGGYNIGANRKVVAIRRFSGENKFSTVFVDPNKFELMLRPNDVVYVSQQKIYQAGNFADNAHRVLSPFTNIASTFFTYALIKNNF